jgi:hypothetical protein
MTFAILSRFAVLMFCGAAISPPSSLATRAESIERVATLRVDRSVHTATTLRSGQVLIVGGMAEGGRSLDGVELFDPRRNTTEELSTLAERRASHTATLLPDGGVLVAGGYDGSYLQSIELYDPATRRWRSAGVLADARSGHTATLLPDGRVLFVGGVGHGWTFLRSAELYDPATGRSELVGSMRVPRESHTATLLTDGRVVIIGGHSGRRQNMEVYASAEVYSPQTRRFDPAGALVTPRHKHDAVRLRDGRVLVVGGADRTDRRHFESTEIFSPKTATFEQGPSMNHRRYKIAGTSVVLGDGDVLIAAGARRAELLDGNSGRFREIPGPFPDAYRFAAVSPLPSGDVIIAGGYADGNTNTSGIWRFRGR